VVTDTGKRIEICHRDIHPVCDQNYCRGFDIISYQGFFEFHFCSNIDKANAFVNVQKKSSAAATLGSQAFATAGNSQTFCCKRVCRQSYRGFE
jgi:hypothetical protein